MDVFTPEKRSEVMSRIRGRDTQPELALRSLLHRLGYRFTVNGPKNKSLPGKPDQWLAACLPALLETTRNCITIRKSQAASLGQAEQASRRFVGQPPQHVHPRSPHHRSRVLHR
jgi:G:T-mismatch repair DNA endonuclease (very short patch repair protein)